MNFFRKGICVFGLLGMCAFGAVSANGKVFYISQSSTKTTGGTTGCGDTLSVAWFNNSSSGGAASHQIGPGTTVYLCGTFRGTPNQQLLKVHGSGLAGSPIVIKFASGANLSAPYWSGGGAINMDNVSHVTIDGGSNGVIQNTDNGTGRHYHATSRGISAVNCTGCVVSNLTIQNLYVRTSNSDYYPTSMISCVYWHLANSFTVNHITCHDAVWAIAGDGNNFTLEYSNLYRVDHGVASGPAHAAGGYNIHHNHFHDTANWDSPLNRYHHDGIHLWGQNGGAITGGAIYNNTFDGDYGANITAHIFLQDSIRNVKVYNNTTLTPSTRTIMSVWFYAASTSLPGGSASGNSAYNNSINAGGHRQGSALAAYAQFNFTAVNNILSGGSSNISIQRGGSRSSTGVNHNTYRNLFAEIGDVNTFGLEGKSYYVLTQWRTACRCDGASSLITSAQTSAFSATAGGTVGTTSTEPVETAYSATVGLSPAQAAAVLAEGASEETALVSTAVAAGVQGITPESTTTPDAESAVIQDLTAAGIGQGLNLTDIAVDDLAPLATDQNGAARPLSGPWNIGPN
jgi:hypothetical protein